MPDQLRKLYVEPTSRCNLNCRMCFRRSWINETTGDMDSATFDRIFATMPESVGTVFFGGMGEPLLHESLCSMVRAMKKAGKRVELLTNGTLLSGEVSRELLLAGLDMLWVSMDSFDDNEYGAIRHKSSLPLVKNNLMLFNAERVSRKLSAKLGLAFVVMRSNAHQLGELPLFASRFRVSEINISHVIPTCRETEAEIVYNDVINLGLGTSKYSVITPRINVPMMDWRQTAVVEGMKNLLSSPMCDVWVSGQPVARKRQRCRFIEEGHTFVRYDGNVSPCMALLRSSTTYWEHRERVVHSHFFGNAREENLAEIWQSENYTAFRRRVQSFEFPPCFRCSHCDEWAENKTDCFKNPQPTCGACLWAEGVITCP